MIYSIRTKFSLETLNWTNVHWIEYSVIIEQFKSDHRLLIKISSTGAKNQHGIRSFLSYSRGLLHHCQVITFLLYLDANMEEQSTSQLHYQDDYVTQWSWTMRVHNSSCDTLLVQLQTLIVQCYSLSLSFVLMISPQLPSCTFVVRFSSETATKWTTRTYSKLNNSIGVCPKWRFSIWVISPSR